MRRPSKKELYNKIKTAKEIVTTGNIYQINQGAIAADAIELGYQIVKLRSILLALFEEVQIENYIGGRPPQKSYETQIKSLELFEFRWLSKKFGCDVYLKYSLKNEIFYLVSLHKHRS
jgi:hypothetical protein